MDKSTRIVLNSALLTTTTANESTYLTTLYRAFLIYFVPFEHFTSRQLP